ncbi:MAG: hybrid sensor histidine kinase/response regulator [Anaerolineae bacterium]
MMNSSIVGAGTPFSGDILIVDDAPANLRLLSAMLVEQGYKARTAPDGPLALASAQASPPDLVLLDIKMPGMNGYEVCQALKANPRTRDIPVIFISAQDQVEDKVKAFKLGGMDYITKPFQIEEVLARVETHLALHTLRRQLVVANEKLQEANAELEASNAELNAFAHTVAHDLKAPLSIILGFSTVLLEMDFTQMLPEVEKSLQSIVRTSFKMRDIIEALLLLASVRQVKNVKHEQLYMGMVVNEALARLEPDIEAAQAEIVTPDTWPTVWGYAPWIEEVWVNYISNALKYGGDAESDVAPRVELGAAQTQNQAGYRFFVRDNGPGLTPEKQAKLFTPFTRFHQYRAKGHGLGLSIVQRIVEKLGGQVGVDSAGAGQGCTFWFVLPANDLVS